MSYILDALRRADAERKSGRVPSIHTVPAKVSARFETPPQNTARWLWWLAGAVALMLIASVWLWRPAPRVVVAGGTAPVAGGTAPVAAVTAPASPMTPSTTSVAAPETPVATAPLAAARAVPVDQRQAPSAAVEPTRAPAPNARSARSTEGPAGVPAAPAAVAPRPATSAAPVIERPRAAAVDEPRLPTRGELPPDIQRQLPPLTLTGSVYSPQAQNRMVIVDGRLAFEGEQVANGLVVERIQAKSVVMRFQNHRFSLPL